MTSADSYWNANTLLWLGHRCTTFYDFAVEVCFQVDGSNPWSVRITTVGGIVSVDALPIQTGAAHISHTHGTLGGPRMQF